MVSLGLLLAVDKAPMSKPGVPSSQEYIQQLKQYINGGEIAIQTFHQTCSDAAAFLLSHTGSDSSPTDEGLSQVIRLLCRCPAHLLTPRAMETGVYVWKLLVSAAPQLGSLVLQELVDAWLWTIDKKRGLFAFEMRYSGPAAKLRPHLSPGVPELLPERDPVEGIIAHRLWIGFFADWFNKVTPHGSVEQLMHIGRLLQRTIEFDAAGNSHFSRHPNAAGTFFSVMLLALKFSSRQREAKLEDLSLDYNLLEDQVYRASFGWFVNRPGFHDAKYNNFAKDEAQCVLLFTQFLLNEKVDSSPKGGEKTSANSHYYLKDQHPVWGRMDNYANGREKRKQLLIIMCHHEADRLDVWANPTKARKNVFYCLKFSSHKGMEYKFYRLKYSPEKWIEFAKIAFSVDPQIAFSLVARFPSVFCLKAEVAQLVQSHTTEIRNVPEALPYLFTPEAVQENSTLLEQLPQWAACSVTQAFAFLTPAYASNPHVKAYVLNVLESYSPESVTRFLSQLVQTLRYGDEKLVVQIAQRSTVCSHMLIWHVQAEICSAELQKQTHTKKRDRYVCCLIVREQNSSFQDRLRIVKQRIIDGLTPEAWDLFQRESDLLDKITSISGLLVQYPKEDRRAVIKRELEKIELNGDDLYLPITPSKLIRSIQLDSGTPLQSATRVPIMITFNVVDRDDDQVDLKPQACIFKVGDDCRQDVLALQVISLLRDIFEAVGVDLYLFPYAVLPTGPERGIIEVVPHSSSRSQMGESNAGDLFEIFQHRFGPVGSPSFETARGNFMRSSAGYAVASLLLQLKDRHNGNLLFDNTGRLVHIDFGFIFGTSPGGNMRFENAQFKLSHDMTRLLDPSGSKKSETWMHFVSLCVKGYLAARLYMDELINTVQLMVDSGLPCFSKGDPIGNFRKRFHPEMSERQAATFMIHTCEDAYNKWTTALYDSIQYWQNGIKK